MYQSYELRRHFNEHLKCQYEIKQHAMKRVKNSRSLHTLASLTSRTKSTSGIRSTTAREAAAMWGSYHPLEMRLPIAASLIAEPIFLINVAAAILAPKLQNRRVDSKGYMVFRGSKEGSSTTEFKYPLDKLEKIYLKFILHFKNSLLLLKVVLIFKLKKKYSSYLFQN